MRVTYIIPSFGDSTLIAGEVTSIVGDQVVVKSASEPPSIGNIVYGEKGKAGTVADVIGAVGNSFFIVKPNPKVKINVGDKLRLK